MDYIIIEDFRCFHKKQKIPLTPVTILIGENSAWKTSFLAALKIAYNFNSFSPAALFNQEPFVLGAYENIANKRGGKGGMAKKFSIGFGHTFNGTSQSANTTPGRSIELVATYEKGTSTNPSLVSWHLSSGEISLLLDIKNNEASIKTGSDEIKIARFHPISLASFGAGEISDILRYMDFIIRHPDKAKEISLAMSTELVGVLKSGVVEKLRELLDRLHERFLVRAAYSFSPIRTTPQRTYNSIVDTDSPAGDHIPSTLSIVLPRTDKKSDNLKSSLLKFGKESGLYQSIDVKRFGKNASDPFQLKVKISGLPVTLADVGYGVSQVLPIIVDTVLQPDKTVFLMQQPEVHLHPKGQASLGSFILEMATNSDKKFIIETHSDYLINRMLADVRDKKIDPNSLSLLYFCRKNNEVTIKSIKIDNEGNLINPPTDFRSFFMDEEKRFLGI